MGVWIRALRLYGNPEALDEAFPLSLFDTGQDRQRASKGQA
jgi:hypothetical protein